MLEPLLDAARASLGEHHATTLRLMHELGDAIALQNRFERAEAILEDAYTGRREALGPSHSSTLASLRALGDVRAARGDRAGAIEAYRALFEAHRASGQATPAGGAGRVLAMLLHQESRTDEALGVLNDAIDLVARALGPNDAEASRLEDLRRRLAADR